MPHRIPDARKLDLYYIRAEVCKLGCRQRTCDHVAGIDDSQAHQGALSGTVWGGRGGCSSAKLLGHDHSKVGGKMGKRGICGSGIRKFAFHFTRQPT
jgi:hypothetical protein